MKQFVREFLAFFLWLGFLPILAVLAFGSWLWETDEELARASWEDDD